METVVSKALTPPAQAIYNNDNKLVMKEMMHRVCYARNIFFNNCLISIKKCNLYNDPRMCDILQLYML